MNNDIHDKSPTPDANKFCETVTEIHRKSHLWLCANWALLCINKVEHLNSSTVFVESLSYQITIKSLIRFMEKSMALCKPDYIMVRYG